MWLMPLLVFLFAVAEYVMFRLYNKLGHPWKVILDDSFEVMVYNNSDIIPHISKLKMMDGREDVAYFEDNVQLLTTESVPEVNNHSYLIL